MLSERYFPSRFMRQFPELVMLESRRGGGVSEEPYNSLNLGLNTHDDKEKVCQNRSIFFDELKIASEHVAGGLQVHGVEILEVESGGYFSGYDAFVTRQKGLFLTIGIADCTPVLIYDSVSQCVGAAHAGWRGTVAEIGTKVLARMKELYGTNPVDCYAFIGTCIDTEHFEVGLDVAEQFESEFVHFLPGKTKPHVDLKAANYAQLLEAGILPEHVEVSPFSTVLNNDWYFSYRHESGQTGRMLAVIGIRS